MVNENYIDNTDVVVTSYSKFKISPNTKIVFETVYNRCNHKDIKEVNFNLNKTTLDDLSIVYECFSKHTYKEDDNSIYYYAFGDYTCDYLDEDSSFILETKTKVVESNANDKSVDKYIWNLNSKEVKENGIYFQIMKENKIEKKDSSLIPWYIKLILSIMVICTIVGSISYIKKHS